MAKYLNNIHLYYKARISLLFRISLKRSVFHQPSFSFSIIYLVMTKSSATTPVSIHVLPMAERIKSVYAGQLS